ncbi:WW domain-binding protein 4-like [Octopus sinensis]|uniref:WW domain-binding protein 4-like n=1 Tax=Octopus sinensis TaxID=2607531 RepID=A0A6P7U0Q9_9MOLL|nr:WW domain-binding protein 4-like [Octopus sinensis]
MADYWKSHEKKYCEFCRCWFCVQFHESGEKHKENVRKRVDQVHIQIIPLVEKKQGFGRQREAKRKTNRPPSGARKKLDIHV